MRDKVGLNSHCGNTRQYSYYTSLNKNMTDGLLMKHSSSHQQDKQEVWATDGGDTNKISKKYGPQMEGTPTR